MNRSEASAAVAARVAPELLLEEEEEGGVSRAMAGGPEEGVVSLLGVEKIGRAHV